MNRMRPKGMAIAGAAVLALGGGATVAMGYGHVGGGGSSGGSGGGDTPQQAVNRYVIGAWLDADQETSTTTGNLDDAHGKFEARLRRQGNMWVARNGAKLDYGGLTGRATVAHIHLGRLGTPPGGIVKNICGTGGTPACSDGVSVPFAITNTQLNAIKQGRFYINVHTARNPAGEIRGQLGRVYRVIANANARQERPRPRNTRRRASGRLTGYLVKYGNRGHLDTKLTYRRLTGPATVAHLHLGRPGQSGLPRVTLCNGTPQCRSGVTGMHDVGGSFLQQLLRGRTYVNVHTRQNPDGEIRGQVSTPRAR